MPVTEDRIAGVVALALVAAACNYSLPRLGGDGGGGDGGHDAQMVNRGCTAMCGATEMSDCCASPLVPGNANGAAMAGEMFYRSYDVGADGMFNTNMGFAATVSDFRLDTYEVTVGRFRAFVNAGMGTQANPPAERAGAHTQVPDSGWESSFNSSLNPSTSTLIAALGALGCGGTWTDTPGSNENLPMTCTTWYEAFAFCIWDGGYLPTEAEWNYTASGGNDQRAYPWSSPPSSTSISCSNANYDPNYPTGPFCVDSVGANGNAELVGSESPTGDGKWGQTDLGGNTVEWNLDWFASPYLTATCDDCANLTVATDRVVRGGSFATGAPTLRAANRDHAGPGFRALNAGVRCARAR
jgi:formylglycine-generating enzyme required for sulfatase activity